LPEWFIQKDKDEDGQVTMAEFSNSWSDATVAEFLRYDLDGDGVITPKECLDALSGKPGLMASFTPGGGSGPVPGGQGVISSGSAASGSVSTQQTGSSGTSSGGSRSAWDDPGSNFW
jgi:Ca2+-binding EF-hand superfamily protein